MEFSLRSRLALAISLLSASVVLAELADPIKYEMEFDLENSTATVRIELPEKQEGRLFQMPAWRPGDYFQFDYGKRIRSVKFFHEDQEVEGGATSNPNVFRAAEPFTSVEYVASASRGNFTLNLRVIDSLIFVSGGAVLGWIDNRQYDPVSFVAKSPGPEYIAVMGLEDPTKAPVIRPNLEALGDLPLLIAKELVITPFEVAGVKHQVVAFGNLNNYVAEGFVTNGRRAAQEAYDMFGSFPYKSYTYYVHFGDMPAGLEGAEASRIGAFGNVARSSTPLMFHEYVHAYNVKHIRPESLRVIDLANPPTVSSLWWLEGGTDYLADVLRHRSGMLSKNDFLKEMASAYFSMSGQGGGGYSQISLTESSRKVWQTRGSQGFGGVSYYTKGKAVAFLLDLAIRRESSGLKSLDDVFVSLYRETGPGKPGYSETRIRELCVEFGGERVGALYDLIVETPAPLPWNEILNRAGFAYRNNQIVLFDQAEPMAKTIASEYPLPPRKLN